MNQQKCNNCGKLWNDAHHHFYKVLGVTLCGKCYRKKKLKISIRETFSEKQFGG